MGPKREKAAQHLVAWLSILVIAIVCGLALDHTTFFWIGVLAAWVMRP